MTRFNYISKDWKRVKNHCRTTMRKQFTENDVTDEFKTNLLISEHSPIRLIEVDWTWDNIKYWVSTEWSRHKFEKFISSQRNDRQKDFDRNAARQDSLVNFDGYANAQNLIDAWRKRMCFCATKEARELAEDLKKELHEKMPELSDVLVPNCIYRCGCPEIKSCGFFWKFFMQKESSECNLFNIVERYKAYNKYFWGKK